VSEAGEDLKNRLDEITDKIIGAAIRVHQEIGPGVLESACESCLVFELTESGLAVERQKPVPLIYRGQRLEVGYRVDVIVESLVVVEVKSIERLERVHTAQLLSYLRLLNLRVGLLINFNVAILKAGIRRVVNNYPD